MERQPVPASPILVKRKELYREAEGIRLTAQKILIKAAGYSRFKEFWVPKRRNSEQPLPLVLNSFSREEERSNNDLSDERYRDFEIDILAFLAEFDSSWTELLR